MINRHLLVTALLSAVSGCSNPLTCDGMAVVWTIQVNVRDQQSGAPINAHTTVIAKRHGGGADTTTSTGTDAEAIPVGRQAGTYDLVIRKSGYAELSIGNVEVANETCHPASVRVDAKLTKIASP